MKRVFLNFAYLVFMLLLISIISFFAIHLAPNSFFASGELNPNITPEVIENLKAVYGLDKPLIVQYMYWLKSMLVLDFGTSFASGNAVSDEILSRIGVTLFLNLTSIFLTFYISIKVGIFTALSSSKTQNIIKNLALVSYAMPSFYFALILIFVFAYKFELFPIAGLHSVEELVGLAYYLDMLHHLVLPLFVMTFGSVGAMLLYVRALVVDILKSDYVFYARSRGFDDDMIIKHYILPNLRPPVITLLGLSLPAIFGGSVILESIFGINGIGLLFYQSAMSHDYPVIMGVLIIGAFLTLLGNMIADLILLKINPFAR